LIVTVRAVRDCPESLFGNLPGTLADCARGLHELIAIHHKLNRMKSLFDKTVLDEILQRFNALQPDVQRQWGKMDVAQMMAHCSATMEVATGQKFPPRTLIGRILGPLVKPAYVGEKPFSRNSPTDPSFVVLDAREFKREKERLTGLVLQFSEGGESKCTTHPHSFFGKLTPKEWSVGMYKHLDHHLRQFGG
jgi:hypothetical protein